MVTVTYALPFSPQVFTELHSGDELISTGSTGKRSLKASGYSCIDYYMSWVKDKPGHGLEWIGYIYSRNSTLILHGNSKIRL